MSDTMTAGEMIARLQEVVAASRDGFDTLVFVEADGEPMLATSIDLLDDVESPSIWLNVETDDAQPTRRRVD